MKTLSALTLVISAAAGVAMADTTTAPLTYEVFENAVPHMDLETCPDSLGGEATFCRATLHHEMLNIFAFSYDGDSPMVGFQSYPAEGLETLLK